VVFDRTSRPVCSCFAADAACSGSVSHDVANCLDCRPPTTENATLHLIAQQKQIATRYGKAVVRGTIDALFVLLCHSLFVLMQAEVHFAMAKEDYDAASSLTKNASFLVSSRIIKQHGMAHSCVERDARSLLQANYSEALRLANRALENAVRSYDDAVFEVGMHTLNRDIAFALMRRLGLNCCCLLRHSCRSYLLPTTLHPKTFP